MKKVAFFDWDKTVRFGGYVLFDFIKILVQKGIFDESIESEIDGIMKEHSEGRMEYTTFAGRAIQIYRKIYSGGTSRNTYSSIRRI